MTSRVEIPDPDTTALDDRDLSTQPVPLDASGAMSKWARAHLVEIAIFFSTIVLLGISTFLIMRDPGPRAIRDVDVVGPGVGQDLEPYIAVRRRALDDAAATGGERAAVVSFTRRITTAELSAVEIPANVDLAKVVAGVRRDDAALISRSEIESWIEKETILYRAQLNGADEQLAAEPSPEAVADWFRTQRVEAEIALERLAAGDVIKGLLISGPVRDLAFLQSDPLVKLVDLAAPGKSPDEIIPVLVGASE